MSRFAVRIIKRDEKLRQMNRIRMRMKNFLLIHRVEEKWFYLVIQIKMWFVREYGWGL